MKSFLNAVQYYLKKYYILYSIPLIKTFIFQDILLLITEKISRIKILLEKSIYYKN